MLANYASWPCPSYCRYGPRKQPDCLSVMCALTKVGCRSGLGWTVPTSPRDTPHLFCPFPISSGLYWLLASPAERVGPSFVADRAFAELAPFPRLDQPMS